MRGARGFCTELTISSIVTGVSVVGDEQVRIFPNPSNGLFSVITSADGLVKLSVTDINGRAVHSESYTATPGTAHSIDISKQANGIYTLRIETEKGTGGVRLVKE